MARKRTESTCTDWNGPHPAPEAFRRPPFGFRVLKQNVIVHANQLSYGECGLT